MVPILVERKKVQVFNDLQGRYLKPYGFTKDNMPRDFYDWFHNVDYKQANEIFDRLKTDFTDPNVKEKLMKFYDQHLTKKSFVTKTATTTKKTASAKFDSDAWREIMRKQNLETMETWCFDWVDTLTESQERAIVKYTGNAYREMNKYLRTNGNYDTTDRFKQYIRQCQDALKKASLPKDAVVRRGSGYNMLKELGLDISKANKDKLIGGIVQDLGFLSTSPAASGGFNSSIEYFIKIPKGSQAMYVAPISKFSDEKELLVNCGGKFIINDIEFNNDGDVKRIFMTLKNLKGPK